MKSTNQVFIDANIFTYLLTDHPVYGKRCFDLLETVEQETLQDSSLHWLLMKLHIP